MEYVVSHKLRKVRKSLGLTIRELSELSGIAFPTIQTIETGCRTSKINVATAQAISAALYTEVSGIFNTSELSNLGRPPLTGGNYQKGPARTREVVCPNCYLAVPSAPLCNQCGEQLPK